jgi:hypothetical protein
MGSGSSPLSCGVFLPPPLLQAFPLLVAGRAPPLPLEPLRPCLACLFTVLGRIPSPCSLALSAPHPLCNVSLLFLLFISQFLFFPWVEVSLPRELCCSGPGLSVEVPCTAKLTLSASSHVIWARATGGPGALLVSLFNMKWRSSAPAGGVEGSKFCLFLVVLPARCVSSVSPRFHYRRHAFCFLPLAAILEFSSFLNRWTCFMIPYLPLSNLVTSSFCFKLWSQHQLILLQAFSPSPILSSLKVLPRRFVNVLLLFSFAGMGA